MWELVPTKLDLVAFNTDRIRSATPLKKSANTLGIFSKMNPKCHPDFSVKQSKTALLASYQLDLVRLKKLLDLPIFSLPIMQMSYGINIFDVRRSSSLKHGISRVLAKKTKQGMLCK